MKSSIEPNYFIVGAAKAGTNKLAYHLTEHPEAFIVPQKEVNYFSHQEIRNQKLYYKNDFIIDNEADYLKLFKETEQFKVRGEGSVSYLFYESVPHKIKAKYPDAKIIIILRDPIKRAYSHYLMDYRIGLVKDKFIDIVAINDINNNYYQQYIGLSLYYNQVERYISEFGKQNVKVILFEDFVKDAINSMKDICIFLGIDENYEFTDDVIQNDFKMANGKIVKNLYSNYYIRKFFAFIFPENVKSFVFSKFFSKKKPSLSSDEKKALISIFKDDVKKLGQIVDIDLSCWDI